MPALRARLLLLTVGALNAACLGQGDGWVQGSLWVDNCRDGEALGQPQGEAPFDLHADFFAGEILDDSNESLSQRANRLVLRIQNTSNNVEVSDGLMIQLNDVGRAALAFAQRDPLPVTAANLCPGGACAIGEDLTRASLYLYASCPQCQQPLVGSGSQLDPSATESSCMRFSGRVAAACPTLSSTDREQLDRLCHGDFNDASSAESIGGVLGGGACLFLCSFGGAERGQDEGSLAGFRIDYGERVAGILSVNLVDGRAINLQTCARAAGAIRGMFDFEIERGRAAQSFP